MKFINRKGNIEEFDVFSDAKKTSEGLPIIESGASHIDLVKAIQNRLPEDQKDSVAVVNPFQMSINKTQ